MPTLLWSVRIITVADKCSLCLIVKTWAWPIKNKKELKTHQIREETDPKEAKIKQLDTKDLVFPHDLSLHRIGQEQVYAKCSVMSLAVSPVCPCVLVLGYTVYSICGTWYIRPGAARPGFSLQLCRRVQWVASGQWLPSTEKHLNPS